MIFRDILILSTLASFTGVVLGYILIWVIEDNGWLLMFGETVHPVINPPILAGIFSISVIIQVFSGLLIGNMMTRASPRSLMQETEKNDRESDAPELAHILGIGDTGEVLA